MKTNMKPMKTKFATKNRETILPSKLAQIVNDIVAILLFACAAMVALALITYSSYDSCWSKSIDSPIVYNKLGIVGAYLSDIILYVFGFSAWWIVIGIFYLGFHKIMREKIPTGNWNTIYRAISYIILIASSSTFEYIAFFQIPSNLPDGIGGSFGSLIFDTLYRSLGQAGVSVISLLLVIVSLSFSFGVSWLLIAEKMGAFCEFVYIKLTCLVARKDLKTSKNSDTDVKEDTEAFSNLSGNAYKGQNPTLKTVSAMGDNEVLYGNSGGEPDNSMAAAFNPNNSSAVFVDDDPDFDINVPFDEDNDNDYEGLNLETVVSEVAVEEVPIRRTSGLQIGLKTNHIQTKDLLDVANKDRLPTTSLLNLPRVQSEGVSPETIEYVSNAIQSTLAEFGVSIVIANVESGPVITRYEFIPPKGVRGDKIAGLAKEIARSLALPNVRIVETIPGKNSMGIEVPNFKRQVIYLKEIFDSAVYHNNNSLLTLALGKDIAGEVIVTDLAKMPHLLVAGTTGSGKSVAVNAMILSILFNASPSEVKFIMIDPKMVELSFYQDIPHLLAPVVTDMSQAANALKWTVGEMERRYKTMAKVGTKNIVGFNQKIENAIKNGEPIVNPYSADPNDPDFLEKWPYIVVIIDELADLMMVAGKKIEQYIARIAQKARAVGIHLIVATQRPSVDVITGLIKANIPARISFQVSSKIDSRTILDQMGAETLLGQGDMLFLNPGSGFPRRIHGAFVNDDELNHVVEYLKEFGSPDYNEEILQGMTEIEIPGLDDDSGSDNSVEKDSVFDEAVKFILDSKRCSISSLQTQFGIGYNKAARIMNHLEKIGMVRRNERGGFELINRT